eukprot:COSAG06_NODE_20678_length_785_cov_3.762391_1_plen_76_part_00
MDCRARSRLAETAPEHVRVFYTLLYMLLHVRLLYAVCCCVNRYMESYVSNLQEVLGGASGTAEELLEFDTARPSR